MSESVERVTEFLHAALLLRAEPGSCIIGKGRTPHHERMSGENVATAMERIEWAAAGVAGMAEDILPADLTEVARAFRVLTLAEEWARAVIDERRFYRMSQSPSGAPTAEWEAAAMHLNEAEGTLLAAVLDETEG